MTFCHAVLCCAVLCQQVVMQQRPTGLPWLLS